MIEQSAIGPPPGKAAFQRYRLIRRIARGGMAAVYLAVLQGAAGFERRVALKKILPVYAGMEEFATLFRDEARIWATLNHSAIVQVYDFGSSNGDYWIAMEFVDGPDLEEVLDRCRRRGLHPPVDVVIHLGHRLAAALEYAHGVRGPDGERLDIIHRDVSPPNILLSVQGEVKLTDFGVARAAVRDSATRPGVLRGKYAYMSPEQVLHRPIDHRSDLFGLGILLYETLTGVNPFEGATDYQTIESVGRAEVEPAGFLRADTPAELDRILLGLLEPDPELRYQTGGELRRDLAALMLDRPKADEPRTLLAFLRELFPERAPQPISSNAGHTGPPVWAQLAHLLTPADVPVPERFPEIGGAGVRLEERPPLLDSLWVSNPPSGDSWGGLSTEDTAAGVETRLQPPKKKEAPDSTAGWSAEAPNRHEWSVPGEDPEQALHPTDHAVPVPVRMTADLDPVPPLPWADDPDQEPTPTANSDYHEEDEDLRATDPELRAVDFPVSLPERPDESLQGPAPGAAVPLTPPGRHQPIQPAPSPGQATDDPPLSPEVDALLQHIGMAPPVNEFGLPAINEWDLGESAFAPRDLSPTAPAQGQPAAEQAGDPAPSDGASETVDTGRPHEPLLRRPETSS